MDPFWVFKFQIIFLTQSSFALNLLTYKHILMRFYTVMSSNDSFHPGYILATSGIFLYQISSNFYWTLQLRSTFLWLWISELVFYFWYEDWAWYFIGSVTNFVLVHSPVLGLGISHLMVFINTLHIVYKIIHSIRNLVIIVSLNFEILMLLI